MADPITLPFVQGQRFQRVLRWKSGDSYVTFAGRSWRSQVRAKESISSPLLIDLTPYITLAGDGLALLLDVPGTVTFELEPRNFKDSASWDLFTWPTGSPEDAVLVAEGPATCDPATTDLSP